MKLKEKTIENKLWRYYSQDFITKRQVRISHKRIDIVTKCRVTSEVWAIEVKIHDWKGALQQALLNTMACNKSFVALWHEHAKPALNNKDLFADNGVGLMIINSNYEPEIVVTPRYCTNINAIAYDKVTNSL